ncbi:hypothetical protein BpHYR1_000600 [Brachionus plicatilis]|uniref:Uncharacterized protein n=1 Tax=Brachionus plicatilis TaxID=10195 RepID=A0A3M7R5V8_BRAPC|nr:hypothetical protein BpHYR1_000600 [Brachionus plicatilis]
MSKRNSLLNTKFSFKYSAKASNALNFSYETLSLLLLFGNGSSTSSSVTFSSLAARPMFEVDSVLSDLNQSLIRKHANQIKIFINQFANEKKLIILYNFYMKNQNYKTVIIVNNNFFKQEYFF